MIRPILDFDDHFTSHTYRNLYWTSFENAINREVPSPECLALVMTPRMSPLAKMNLIPCF
ncbi:hypothetical protein B0H10DRAFT_2109592 [Mycena sp. CBHHK59/15]|nr:hypothetical protein B0H10DRAFT_2109592 [Mycena sp. CBHHK59/15]